ncbi:OLC1v1009962C1 [Oldenlandia corymbosa var. corymbosa]|uniref:OLC1v1009962C1 n=1 Tax=Oldenlandia corymbosa var. corymbosa TaxID=529605 RepID=A0AAV1DTF7_OLDCO|nr:OLC1v1009962C1 [Oldenlandia corymbosa var. corymbosa]
MAFKKTLAQRLSNIYRITSPSLTSCRITSSPAATSTVASRPKPDTIAPDPGDAGVFRRFLHRRPLSLSSSEIRSLPTGQGLIEKLRGMDISRDRIRLDGLIPPPVETVPESSEGNFSVTDLKKLLRLSQLDLVKEKLRQIEKSYISHDEFVEICRDGCWSRDDAQMFAKTLDESGTVVVLGNVVLLRPEQVVKAVQGLMPVPSPNPNDPRLKEFQAMEELKGAIDRKADSLVRRELWCGLGYFVIQTAAFMRLTFWELSWDVMEPICFYVTTLYCMAGYAFFLRTSIEPSFEGFFQSRFAAKQKRLMKLHNFDLEKYNELRRAFDHRFQQAGLANASSLNHSNKPLPGRIQSIFHEKLTAL